MRSVAASLFEALSGLGAGDRTRFRLTDQVIELLAADPSGSPRVVVIDLRRRRIYADLRQRSTRHKGSPASA